MSPFASFRATRWVRTANLVLQAILFLTLFVQLNYLASTHGWQEDPWRYDLTKYRRYTLSPETIAYLKDLSNPVHIYVTMSEDAAGTDVKGLLREYQYATEANADGKVTVEYLDIDRDRRKAQELNIDQPNEVILMGGYGRQTVPIDKFYSYQNQQRRDFQGESAITAAILDVSSAVKKKVLFLVGHGELSPNDVDPVRGLSVARDRLRERNFDWETFDLSSGRPIPEGAVLIAVQPRTPYTEKEQEMLRQYLGNNYGRLILFLAPRYRHGLNRLLQDWAVIADDDVLIDSGPDNLTEDGDFVISWFAPDHDVTKVLLRSSFKARLRVGQSRSIRPDLARAASNGLNPVTLAATSTTAWGQVNYAAPGAGAFPQFHRGIDISPLPSMSPPNRLGIAVASEPVAAKNNLPFSVRTGRLIVFGTGDLIDNARIANPGVLDMLIGSVDWMVNRDTQLNIRPLPIERFQLFLSARELENLRRCLMFVLPGIAAILGMVVYWTRRT